MQAPLENSHITEESRKAEICEAALSVEETSPSPTGTAAIAPIHHHHLRHQALSPAYASTNAAAPIHPQRATYVKPNKLEFYGGIALAGFNLCSTILLLFLLFTRDQYVYFGLLLGFVFLGSAFNGIFDFLYSRPRVYHLANFFAVRIFVEIFYWRSLSKQVEIHRQKPIPEEFEIHHHSPQQRLSALRRNMSSFAFTSLDLAAVGTRRAADQCHCVSIKTGVGRAFPACVLQCYMLLHTSQGASNTAWINSETADTAAFYLTVITLFGTALHAGAAVRLYYSYVRRAWVTAASNLRRVDMLFYIRLVLVVLARLVVFVAAATVWGYGIFIVFAGSYLIGIPLLLFLHRRWKNEGEELGVDFSPVPKAHSHGTWDLIIIYGIQAYFSCFFGTPFAWSLKSAHWAEIFLLQDLKVSIENSVLLPILYVSLHSYYPNIDCLDLHTASGTVLVAAGILWQILHLISIYSLYRLTLHPAATTAQVGDCSCDPLEMQVTSLPLVAEFDLSHMASVITIEGDEKQNAVACVHLESLWDGLDAVPVEFEDRVLVGPPLYFKLKYPIDAPSPARAVIKKRVRL